MSSATLGVPEKAKAKAKDTRGFTLLERVQFIEVVDIPAIAGRTIWVDVANKTQYEGVSFLFDPAGFVRLESSKADWRTVIIPLSNVAAMFPMEG